MAAFAKIRQAALARHGAAEMKRRLPPVKSAAALKKVTDDRYFSLLSLRIFRAGLRHSVVDDKWPAFEKAFHKFAPRKVRAMNDEDVEKLLGNAKLIRHLGKLRAVHANAAAMIELAEEHGAMGQWLAAWPAAEIVALWLELARRFEQMGGNSAPRFLRMAGKDTFVLTPAVVLALNHWGAFKGEPKGRQGRAAAQEIFNAWAEETGLPLAHLSMILAASVG